MEKVVEESLQWDPYGNKLAVLGEFLLSVWELNILFSGNCSWMVVMETKWAMHDKLFYQHKMWLRQHFFHNKNGTRMQAQTAQLGQPSFQGNCWSLLRFSVRSVFLFFFWHTLCHGSCVLPMAYNHRQHYTCMACVRKYVSFLFKASLDF